MSIKSIFVKTVNLSYNQKLKFNENLVAYNGAIVEVPYDKETKTFKTNWSDSYSATAEIYILTDAEFQTVVSVTHRLQIPQARFEYLEPNQMFVDNLVLSNCGKNVAYKYYGKRIDKENIEIHIENPVSLGVKLNGKKGDFHYVVKLQDIDLMLSFIFELSESDQETSENESRPESFSLNVSDAEDSVKIFRHPPSPEDDSKASVIEIDLDGNRLKAALDFLSDKPNSIKGFESDLFVFADQWEISSLIGACRPFVKDFINPKNVCETIQTAFKNDLEETKKLCKQFILENKASIDSKELGKLPQEILAFVFCF
uniref:BTB domain-containing protein n=1 Tax=Panagrolaimus sp. ES5 TaxID=591445 RepID=A0AC34GTH5_9BILA